MSTAQDVRGRHPIEVIADILAYFAAKKRYSYVDILGNALDNFIALEVVKDAIRDFKSTCIDQPGADEEAVCPTITPDELSGAGQWLSRELSNADTRQLLVLTREIAVKALARAPKFTRASGKSSPESSSLEGGGR